MDETIKELKRLHCELKTAKEQLLEANSQLEHSQLVINEEELQIDYQILQIQSLVRFINKAELEGTAEDVFEKLRNAIKGKCIMSENDWIALFQAVDKIHPDFRTQFMSMMSNFTEQQIRVCYLMRIGLSNPQIQRITNMPRATVWRWTKKFEWIITDTLETPK